jgi:hypothetical protein
LDFWSNIQKLLSMEQSGLSCPSMIIIAAMSALLISNLAQADKVSETVEVFKKSEAVKPFFESAYGYAVFPTIGKAGLGMGGAYGEGEVFAQGKVTGTASLVKLSVVFQFGGQAFKKMLFFEDKRFNCVRFLRPLPKWFLKIQSRLSAVC